MKKHTSEFKAKVAIEAIQERFSIQEIADRYGITPELVTSWKTEFLSNAESVFMEPSPTDDEISKLKKIQNHLEMERDFLRGALRKLDSMN